MLSLEIFEKNDMYVEIGTNNENGRLYIRYEKDGNWNEVPNGPITRGDGLDYERHAWDLFDKACNYENESYLVENNLPIPSKKENENEYAYDWS